MLASVIGRRERARGAAVDFPDASPITDALGRYIVGADAPAASRRVAAREALRNGRDDYCRAVRSGSGTAWVEVGLDRDGRRIWAGSFATVPSRELPRCPWKSIDRLCESLRAPFVVVATDDLRLASTADQVALLRSDRLLGWGPPEQILSESSLALGLGLTPPVRHDTGSSR